MSFNFTSSSPQLNRALSYANHNGVISAAAALLPNMISPCSEAQAALSVAHAQFINQNLGNGRLDLNQSLQAWQQGQ
jgi:hypothetical protein